MSAVLEHKVNEKENNKTVELILRRQFGFSAKLMTKLKLSGALRINGKICRSVDRVVSGDIITADLSENTASEGIVPCRMELEILYEDDFITVVNKPGGLAVHPSIGNYDSTLANGIMYYWSQKGEYHNYHIVNRLDKDTSGICVIAKNRFAHGVLSGQIKNKIFKRKYTAIVHGSVVPDNGSIEIPIRREESSIIKRVAAHDGKYAKTNYKTVGLVGNGKYTMLEIELETGRTHQIRVHFSHIGHPLVGDWLYGNGDEEKDIIKRHALHAGEISFIHPVTKMEMVFKSELPEEILGII